MALSRVSFLDYYTLKFSINIKKKTIIYLYPYNVFFIYNFEDFKIIYFLIYHKYILP